MAAKKITISIAPDLLRQLDAISIQEFASRSDIIRQALIAYLRNNQKLLTLFQQNFSEVQEEDELSADDVAKVLAKHPYVSPDDLELIKVLYDYDGDNGS